MGGIGVEDEGALWCRKVFDLLVRKRAVDACRPNFVDLVTIDEPQPVVVRFHGNPVEEIFFWDLKHVLHRAKFCP
jgi:hypothetical protein